MLLKFFSRLSACFIILFGIMMVRNLFLFALFRLFFTFNCLLKHLDKVRKLLAFLYSDKNLLTYQR